ncbi:Wadjet anti-phage system protein JetA family protein, partial [Methylobacterium hispanicum]
MLFAQLPDDLFRPLASPSRAFNAALLLHLHRRVIGSEPMRKADLLAEIGDFAAGRETPELADDASFPPDAIERRSALYRRFLESGWLIERRERYVPVVEFDPEARLLLEELSRIERGETRSYGGAVLEVLGSLESALANPGERSEALANAAREAGAFLAHLRSLAGSMRKIEDRILREEDRRAAFRLYFEDFVERHLISDYRTLHTRFNPFRFRSAIVREAGRALRDALLIRALAEGLVREGRAADLDAGERAVRADLAEILSVFEGIDRHLDAVDEVVARMERRIAAAVRYMDRPDAGGVERTAAALR